MANSKKGTAQVNPPSPKQQVGKKFGSKKQLVEAILGLIGDAPEGSQSKLMQTANSKLMSHHHNTQRMVKQFGNRGGAIDAILGLRFPKGAPEAEKAKLERFSPWRLMDLHRQATDAKKKADAAAAKTKKK